MRIWRVGICDGDDDGDDDNNNDGNDFVPLSNA